MASAALFPFQRSVNPGGLERLLGRTRSLATFPDSGRVVLGRQNIREIIVSPYSVMYRRKDDLAGIAAVRHGAREFDEKEFAP